MCNNLNNFNFWLMGSGGDGDVGGRGRRGGLVYYCLGGALQRIEKLTDFFN